jgi:hypothetical protein
MFAQAPSLLYRASLERQAFPLIPGIVGAALENRLISLSLRPSPADRRGKDYNGSRGDGGSTSTMIFIAGTSPPIPIPISSPLYLSYLALEKYQLYFFGLLRGERRDCVYGFH